MHIRQCLNNRQGLRDALLECALRYRVNLAKHEMADTAEKPLGELNTDSDSGSDDEAVFVTRLEDGVDDEALKVQFSPEINRMYPQWMNIKSSKPGFWIYNFSDINENNIGDYTISSNDKGPRMDPLKLMHLDMHKLYMELANDTPYGFIPKLAMCILGRNLSESFVERLFSGASLILTNKASNMNVALVEKLTLLRMNAKFIAKMKEHYPKLLLEMVEMESDEGKKRKADALECIIILK